ncbi:hypothetical protein CQW23_16544 [Capsicum baccatum]|uniref:Uncharacterized protein n=1 Tax=Capsicum baccatum TaxID=33114 RepID=A0A2G2WBG6_CAPBA|nr:hypothetical protein CQW23_16544 [Capsicum baccatum]
MHEMILSRWILSSGMMLGYLRGSAGVGRACWLSFMLLHSFALRGGTFGMLHAATGILFFGYDFSVMLMQKLPSTTFNLTDFGWAGDDVTLNTVTFERAILTISKLVKRGGGQLHSH